MKEAVRSILLDAYVRSGLSRIGHAVRDHEGCMIFYGHRVSEDNEGYMQGLSPSRLDDQLAYLTRCYEVIPLSHLVDCLREGRRPPRKSVVITFDDGFRDNYDQAFPLLQKYDVCATIFVVTASLSTGELPWSQRLGYLFQNTMAKSLRWPATGGTEVSLETAQDRVAAYKVIKEPMKAMSRTDRDLVINTVSSLLRVEAPTDRMMNWDQAREMFAAGFEIGAHTVSHPMLAEIPFNEAKWEMKQSIHDVREHVGTANPPFCFPAGSYNQRLLELVPRLGFSSVFIPNQAIRLNSPENATPYSLSRRGLPNAPARHLEGEVEGPFDAIRSALGRYRR